MHKRVFHVNEGNNYDVSVVLPQDTSGYVVSARLIDISGTGTGFSVGSSSGVTEDTELTMQLGIKNLSPNEYFLEFWMDYGGDNQKIVSPPPNTIYKLKIVDRFGITN